MSWREHTIAQRSNGELLVLEEGIPLRVAFDDLTSSGAPVRVTIQTRVVASDTPADRALISEVMGDAESLDSSRLSQRLFELSRPQVRRAVEAIDAEKALDADVVKSIRQAISAAAFSSGFVLTDPFVIDLTTRKLAPSFSAKPAPNPSPSVTIVVVGGSQLVHFDSSTGHEIKRSKIDPSIGPMRSVSVARDGEGFQFLVGAKSGAAIVRGNGTVELIGSFVDGHSINSMVRVDDLISLTTSAGGLVSWNGSQSTMLDLQPARFTRRVGEHVVFASGPTLRVIDPHGTIDTIAGGAEIVSIFVQDDSCIVVRSDGTIETVDPVEGRTLDVRHVGPCRTASIVHQFSDGVFSLIRPDGSIELRSVTNSLSTRLRGFTGCRACASRDGWIVGVSEDSTKLPVWRSDSPHEPVHVIEAAHVVGHRAADVVVI